MKNRPRGYIFVEALVVIAGLLALMAMLAADGRVAQQETQNRLRQRRAGEAADAAVTRALAVVQDANANLVTLNDDWALLGDSGNEAFNLGGATFRMQIVDAGAMINANTAVQDQLQHLPLNQEQIHCLLDWREPKTQARPDGAKDVYYNSLPTPYNAKLGPLDTTDELLLVKSWTTGTLYQTGQTAIGQALTDHQGNSLPLAAMLTVDSGASNTRPDGQPRVNLGKPNPDVSGLTQAGIRQDIARRIASQAPIQSFSALFALPGMQSQTMKQLLDAVTFTDQKRITGKINLNTATEAVLKTIPNITPAIAEAIVSRQTDGFHSLSDLASVSGVDTTRLGQIADAFTVGGDTWIVRVYGQSGGVSVAREDVIGLRGGRAQIITQTEFHTAGIPIWWGWDTDSSATVDAGSLH